MSNAAEIVNIYLIDEFDKEECLKPAEDFAKSVASLLVPHDVSELLVHRKFVVMRFKASLERATPERAYLLIGPVLKETLRRAGYRHETLVNAGFRLLKKEFEAASMDVGDCEISGGKITVTKGGHDSIELGGASGDYGVFDPLVLRHRRTIAKTLGLPIDFSFHDYVK